VCERVCKGLRLFLFAETVLFFVLNNFFFTGVCGDLG
jgi:hypothetical protein